MIPIITGLGFGDEGKGTITDYLSRKHDAKYVVKFSGGSQTAHNVVLPTGEHHTFSQFGAGSFMGAGTIITKHMLVNPFNMFTEHCALEKVAKWEPFSDTHIEEDALLITPIHIHANRQREINRGKSRHGSCGEGIGEARMIQLRTPLEALRMKDMTSGRVLRGKFTELIKHYESSIENFSFDEEELGNLIEGYTAIYNDIFRYLIKSEQDIIRMIQANKDSLVFEGSQGVLLDQVHGFHPNTTWTDTTSGKALEILAKAGIEKEETHNYGILRTYLTRHGDGAFPSELPKEQWDSYPEEHNKTGRWQGDFRIGLFDIPLMKYAIKANSGVDSIALTHCDVELAGVVTEHENSFPEPQRPSIKDDEFDWDYREMLGNKARSITSFTRKSIQVEGLVSMIEETAPISIMSYGATYKDKVER